MNPFVGALVGSSYTIGMSALAMARSARGADSDLVRRMIKQWAQGMCDRLGIEVRAFGIDTIDWNAPTVVMANHQSYLDILALYQAMPRPYGMVAKRELFSVPFFSGVMRAIGCVSIDRAKGAEAFRSLEAAAAEVRAGSSIVIFPEGTRGPGDRIQPLKKGPFHLAVAARAPVVPIGIRGSAALMSRNAATIRSGSMEVHVGEPIAIEGEGGPAREALRKKVAASLARLAAVPVTGAAGAA